MRMRCRRPSAKRCVVVALLFVVGSESALGMDQPFESVPLPRYFIDPFPASLSAIREWNAGTTHDSAILFVWHMPDGRHFSLRCISIRPEAPYRLTLESEPTASNTTSPSRIEAVFEPRRSVTQMEGQLGVSDNEMPDHTRTVDHGQMALSSYDQSILADGPPPSGDGPPPSGLEGAAPASPPAPQYAPSPQYAQPQYGYAAPVYGQAPQPPAGEPMGVAAPEGYQSPQGYAPLYGQVQQGGYTMYQPQEEAYGGAAPAQAQEMGYSSYPQQAAPTSPQAQQASYYDFSQAQGQLGGANSMIASAASYTEGGANSRLGWHPTLEREMGSESTTPSASAPRAARHAARATRLAFV